MEKLKARLIELYYENLFKVISSDILYKIVVKCVTRSL
jgi:phosphoglycolate phosphatase-like HAD superfamily hydrolase